MYPQPVPLQAMKLRSWREAQVRAGVIAPKPFGQSLYIDLLRDPDAQPTPIHLGWRLGRRALVSLLHELADIGVGHVVLNLKYGSRHAADVLEELGGEVLPHLPAHAGLQPAELEKEER
jgi:hypothetical protein